MNRFAEAELMYALQSALDQMSKEFDEKFGAATNPTLLGDIKELPMSCPVEFADGRKVLVVLMNNEDMEAT